jgi:3-methylcrotonyl-CoA carboxylase alpha subunit
MSHPIRRLLIANRGEIARRISRTCRDLGITAIAAHSEADRDMPFVREADLATCIGPAEAAGSYLNADAVLDAARRTGADAIHPGYGFLSENADFAQAVVQAGLTWVGPPPAAIRTMGDKAAARHMADAHGVPIVPGYDADQDDTALAAAAAEIGAPVLIKALAGGGGRGMRRVDDLADFAEALASARREALSAFGNGDVLLERYIERPRHIEVQVFGDADGSVVHLGERECSIQRRHQKIIEEAPSPAVNARLRARLGEAACSVARAASYVGAGTVEFILAPDGAFYFLEMNTRLQVEHPVTEQVTGQDLVAWQIGVAEGRPLPLTQDQIAITGHSIEVRLYAEDPMRDWLPATGTALRLEVPMGPGIRLDAALDGGDSVGPYYDAMVAKIIATGPDRASASRLLANAVDRAWMPGLVSNLPLLRQILATDAWNAGDLHTGFLVEQGLPTAPPLNLAQGALAATALGWWQRKASRVLPEVPAGWRIHGCETQHDAYLCGEARAAVQWQAEGDGLRIDITIDDEAQSFFVQVHGFRDDGLDLSIDGDRARWQLLWLPTSPTHLCLDDGDTVYVHTGRGEAFVRLEPRFPAAAGAEEDPGSAVASTPGTVVAVHVAVGDVVEKGARLVTLEAMKMEHAVVAGEAGTVSEVRVGAGDAVDEGALLVILELEDGEA